MTIGVKRFKVLTNLYVSYAKRQIQIILSGVLSSKGLIYWEKRFPKSDDLVGKPNAKKIGPTINLLTESTSLIRVMV